MPRPNSMEACMALGRVSAGWAGALGLVGVLIGAGAGWAARGAMGGVSGLEVRYLEGSARVPHTRAIITHAGVKLCDIEYDSKAVESVSFFPPDTPLTMTYYVGRSGGAVKATVGRYRSIQSANTQNPGDLIDLFSATAPPFLDQWVVMGPPRVVKRGEMVWREE